MQQCDIKIMGLCETNTKRSGDKQLKDNYNLYYSGRLPEQGAGGYDNIKEIGQENTDIKSKHTTGIVAVGGPVETFQSLTKYRINKLQGRLLFSLGGIQHHVAWLHRPGLSSYPITSFHKS
ncbi:hypothetical protein FQA39_LY08147 [Lamprigera yunnana]|nr:hypothetical protein FQA39_LY08147 [Lamprigera yunnana]